MILDIDSVKTFLDHSTSDDDARITAAMRQAEQAAAKWCGRDQFESKWYTRTEDLGDKRRAVIAPVRPLTGVPSLCLSDLGFAFLGSQVTTGSPGEITFEDHQLTTGDGPFRVISMGDGSFLPGGLNPALDYWIVRVNDDTIRLATSEANAEAGTAVDISTAPAGGMNRLIGPCLTRSETRFEPGSGVVSLRADAVLPIGPVTLVFRAGLCENGDDAPDDLFQACVEQAAYRFRQAGKVGRLGIVQSEKPAAVVDQYVVAEWAPGVLACLDNYKLRNL